MRIPLARHDSTCYLSIKALVNELERPAYQLDTETVWLLYQLAAPRGRAEKPRFLNWSISCGRALSFKHGIPNRAQ